jgi:HNH endonuclease
MNRDLEARTLGAVPVDGAPGYYVTRSGDVYSSRRLRAEKPLRKLRRGRHPQGYPQHGLVVDGKTITVYLHHIVAAAFLPPRPSSQHVVRHDDGNVDNAHAENLLWGTQLENILDKHRHGTMATGDRNGRRTHPEACRGEKIGGSKLTESQVMEIRRRLSDGEPGSSLAREFRVLKTTISSIKNGRNWKHLGGPVAANGKRLKPEGWTPPDIEGELKKQGWLDSARNP